MPDSTLVAELAEISASLAMGSWLAVASLMVGVVGFGLVILQLRRTRTAAQAASDSAKSAVGAVSSNRTISDMGSVIGGLQEIQTANRGQRFETALLRLQQVRRQLIALRGRPDLAASEVQKLIQTISVTLSKAQRSYEEVVSGGAEAGSLVDLNESLAGYIVELTGLQQTLEFNIGGTNAPS